MGWEERGNGREGGREVIGRGKRTRRMEGGRGGGKCDRGKGKEG